MEGEEMVRRDGWRRLGGRGEKGREGDWLIQLCL